MENWLLCKSRTLSVMIHPVFLKCFLEIAKKGVVLIRYSNFDNLRECLPYNQCKPLTGHAFLAAYEQFFNETDIPTDNNESYIVFQSLFRKDFEHFELSSRQGWAIFLPFLKNIGETNLVIISVGDVSNFPWDLIDDDVLYLTDIDEYMI